MIHERALIRIQLGLASPKNDLGCKLRTSQSKLVRDGFADIHLALLN